MVISSRTPEGESGNCPTCHAEIIIEPSSTLGDATCPSCGQLIWFIRMADGIRTFNSVDDRVNLRLADYLARHGFRMTNQRQLLARLVTAIGSPFSADDLIAFVRDVPEEQRVSSPTVYRTLGEFVDARILSCQRGSGHPMYSLC
ncbi:transcriptional repressor [Roseiconus lacunae]|uniref:transcriptional repressor n=1 Tax=Roseiconus lacunae TaxID=2605694 RepID=UPI0033153253